MNHPTPSPVEVAYVLAQALTLAQALEALGCTRKPRGRKQHFNIEYRGNVVCHGGAGTIWDWLRDLANGSAPGAVCVDDS